MTDTRSRSIVKAVSYRLFGSLSTALVVLFFSGNPKLSAGAGALDIVVKLGLYFLHERLWDRIPFGRQTAPAPDYEI